MSKLVTQRHTAIPKVGKVTLATSATSVHANPSARPSQFFVMASTWISPTENQLPFRSLGQLGFGGTAMVEAVQDQKTGRKFAHESFKYYGKELKKYKDAFKNEIDII
jgi:hypothetical protein